MTAEITVEWSWRTWWFWQHRPWRASFPAFDGQFEVSVEKWTRRGARRGAEVFRAALARQAGVSANGRLEDQRDETRSGRSGVARNS